MPVAARVAGSSCSAPAAPTATFAVVFRSAIVCRTISAATAANSPSAHQIISSPSSMCVSSCGLVPTRFVRFVPLVVATGVSAAPTAAAATVSHPYRRRTAGQTAVRMAPSTAIGSSTTTKCTISA
ncbi:MAG: hypothetical protein LC635_01830 [Pseudonocardiaceae bacterium]|nr:hypothetical protein [Pseudonocardiaceae bacterium]